MGRKSKAKAETADNSKGSTPSQSESDASDDSVTVPTENKQESFSKSVSKSAALCIEMGLNDVDLEYTDADYQNLTTYTLFSRMVRPQLAAANPKITANKMNSLLEAKFQEFRESNPLTKARSDRLERLERIMKAGKSFSADSDSDAKKKVKVTPKVVESESDSDEDEKQDGSDSDVSEEPKRLSDSQEIDALAKKPDSASEESDEAMRPDESDESDVSPTKKRGKVLSDDSGEEQVEEVDEQAASDEEDKEETEQDSYEGSDNNEDEGKSRMVTKITPLRIKLANVTPRRSGRERRAPKKIMSDREFSHLLDSDGRGSSLDDKPRKRGRRKADSEDDFEISSDDDDERPKQKRRGRKKKKPNSDDSEGERRSSRRSGSGRKPRKRYISPEEESGSESGSEDSSFRVPRWKKAVIPGERKSDRTRKKGNDRQMTDREFEKMLKEEEKAKEEKKKIMKKRKKMRQRREHLIKKSKARKAELEGEKNGVGEEDKKKDDDDEEKIKKEDQEKAKEDGNEIKAKEDRKEGKAKEDGNESDHSWYCEICRDGGDLLLCDTCSLSFHKECLNMEDVPDGTWSCPICKGEDLPDISSTSEEEDEKHEHFCKICKDGGDVILCDFCPSVFHLHCVHPPLKEVPEGEWKCPQCVVRQTPLKGKVKQVMFWKWSHQLKGTDELDHTHSPQKRAKDTNKNNKEIEGNPTRMLFVKYEYHSYWDCDWISEMALEVFQPIMFRYFKNRWDQDEPPALEDGSSFGKVRQRHKSSTDEDDPQSLEEKYYRFGIKPEWLQIHRIVTHDGRGRNLRYLVKWRDLPYEECTWEFPEEIPEPLTEEWEKCVDAYWARRKEKTDREYRRPKKEKPKKSTLKKKLEKQPSYIESTGGTLHAYQLEGLNWLRFSWAQGTNTILADEMGLGKTIQAISIIYSLWKEGFAHGPFLVSAPLSTVANWEREFEFWAPELYVLTYGGGKENRIVIRERDFCYKEGAFSFVGKACRLRDGFQPKFDVCLTSYEYINLDRAVLQSIDWDIVVIDEAHRLKSNQSLFFRTFSEYSIKYKLLLTGTPLQNNLEELFNLLNFLEPGKFDDMDSFLNEFADISKEDQVTKLHQMLAPHMLRRLKVDVMKELPPKSEFIVRVELSDLQKQYYKHILTKNFTALNVRGHANQTSLQNIMMDLRKCCNHPYLFPKAQQEAPLAVGGVYEGSALVKGSGKLDLLGKMLKVLREEGHRVLIFSQMTRMLDILEDFLVYMGLHYERIDGNITGSKRQVAIDRFNDPSSPQFVFLLSTRAGGLGINLATADTVVIYDMDWNPHNDIQAFSRAHRIGQKNKVMIYRFVSRNSVEEKMAQTCKRKMMLTELVIHRGMGSQETTDSLSKQELNDILKSGAEQLFRDDEEGKVVYDDEAIKNLLDRSREMPGPGENTEADKELAMNDYLRSFKVASYQVIEKEEEEVEKPKEDLHKEDPAYWEKVLGPSYTEHVVEMHRQEEERARNFGKGKRIKKQINYAETLQETKLRMKLERQKQKELLKNQNKPSSDYEPSSSGDSSEEGVDNEEEDQTVQLKDLVHKKSRKSTEVVKKAVEHELPPLVARVNNQIEVLGFNPRQRRAFLDAVMRFGMPPEDVYRCQWLVRDLKIKSDRVFKAYVSLFMRHLVEPLADGAEKFADGVPTEGLSRQHVLTRIGMLALIRRKVHEFEDLNWVESLSEFKNHRIVTVQESELRNHPTVTVQQTDLEKAGSKTEKGEETTDTGEKKPDSSSKDESEKGTKSPENNQEEKDAKSTEEKTSESLPQQKDLSEKETEEKDQQKETGKNSEETKPTSDEDKKDSNNTPEKQVSDNSAINEGKELSSEKTVSDGVDIREGKSDEVEKISSDVNKENTDKDTSEKDSTPSLNKENKTDQEVMKETKDEEAETEKSQDKHAENKEDSKPDSAEVRVKEEETTDTSDDKNAVKEKSDEADKTEKESREKPDDEKISKEESDGDKAGEVKSETETKTEEPLKEKTDTERGEEKERDVEAMDVDPVVKDTKEVEIVEKKESNIDEKNQVAEKEDVAMIDESEKVKEEKGMQDSETTAEIKQSTDDKPSAVDKPSDETTTLKQEKNPTEEETKMEVEEVKKVDEKKEDTEKPMDTYAKVEELHDSAKETKTDSKDNKQVPAETVKEVVTEEPVKEKTPEEICADLRKRFWIADGGFTELHSLWQYEEAQMVPGKEYETWHRRHDFWLLAGISTHGYRHWQDILNDSRFGIINLAFKTEQEKIRRAAFLNRRFQLLEQALVIEEQLRKAAKEEIGSTYRNTSKNLMEDLDKVGAVVRDYRQSPAAKAANPKLHKAWNSVNNVVADIRLMSRSLIPATMARSTGQFPPTALGSTPGHTTTGSRGGNPKMAPNLAQQLTMARSGGGKEDKNVICLE